MNYIVMLDIHENKTNYYMRPAVVTRNIQMDKV